MLTHLRSLRDLRLVPTPVPRSMWARTGWAEAEHLPTHRGRYLVRLRHTSGGMPPLDVHADWDGQRFVCVRADSCTAIPGTIAGMAAALFERPETNLDQWDITSWVRDEGTGVQVAVA